MDRTVFCVILIAVCGAAVVASLPAREVGARRSVDERPLFFLAEEEAVIVLKDGTEVTGKIVKEDDTAVYIGSVFGTQKILRSKIAEIRRGSNPLREQFESRFDEAVKRKSVRSLVQLAEWAAEKNLTVESERAYRKVIELEPDHAGARQALGHGRLDGEWLDAKRVRELLAQGYVLDGVDLVQAKAGGKDAGPGQAEPRPGSTGVKPRAGTVMKRAVAILGPLDPDEISKRDAERQRKAANYLRKYDKYVAKKLDQHRGVPWSRHWEVKSKRYIVHCDVATKDSVARQYLGIMDELHKALSKRIRGKDQHRYRSNVYIYKDQQEFMSETGSPPGVGGFFQPANKEIRGYHGTFGSTGTTFAVLAHEGTHLFQALKLGNIRNMPQWLTEGMAVYFGDGSRLDPVRAKIQTSLIPRDRLLHLQDKISRDSHTKLKPLVRIPYGSLSGSQYADAWSLCYFLFDGPRVDEGRRFIEKYWLAAKERKLTYKDFTDLAGKYFDGMTAMESEWQEYTKSLVPEPVGKIRGERIESYDFKFNWELPSEGWEWVTGKLANDALVGMQVPDTGVECRMAMRSRDHRQSEDEYAAQLEASLSGSNAVTDVAMKRGDFFGVPHYKFTYRMASDDDESDDDDKAEPAPNGKPKLRRSLYVFVSFNRAYWLYCEAPVDQYEELEPYFLEVAKNVELVPEIRW